MRRVQRLIAACVLIAFSGVLGACSGSLSNFDPTDLLDWLDTKKKLQGERKPVFPDGVPGLEQGVPRDLYKDQVEQQQRQDEQNARQLATAPTQQPQQPQQPQQSQQAQQSQQPLEPPPGSKAALKKLKAKQQAAAQPAGEADGETAAASQADGTQATASPPKPKKIVRKRTTAPPPDATDGQQAQQGAPAQQAQPAQSAQQSPPSPFPAPLPGSFSRQ